MPERVLPSQLGLTLRLESWATADAPKDWFPLPGPVATFLPAVFKPPTLTLGSPRASAREPLETSCPEVSAHSLPLDGWENRNSLEADHLLEAILKFPKLVEKELPTLIRDPLRVKIGWFGWKRSLRLWEGEGCCLVGSDSGFITGAGGWVNYKLLEVPKGNQCWLLSYIKILNPAPAPNLGRGRAPRAQVGWGKGCWRRKPSSPTPILPSRPAPGSGCPTLCWPGIVSPPPGSPPPSPHRHLLPALPPPQLAFLPFFHPLGLARKSFPRHGPSYTPTPQDSELLQVGWGKGSTKPTLGQCV